MFKYLKEHAEDLIAVKVTGKLEKADYESLIPEMEEKIHRYGKIKLYWEMEDFEGWHPSAFMQDLQFDVKHANDYKRIAMVGEKIWEEWMSKLMKPFTNAEIKYFDLSERQQAMEWIKEKAMGKEKGIG